ncbi:hypothetical protein Tco_0035861 [Tanacetum coccineum]
MTKPYSSFKANDKAIFIFQGYSNQTRANDKAIFVFQGYSNHLRVWLMPLYFPYGAIELSQTDRPNFKDCPDFEDSRAHGFVHRPIDLKSLACLWECDILDLIDLTFIY